MVKKIVPSNQKHILETQSKSTCDVAFRHDFEQKTRKTIHQSATWFK